MSLMLTPYFEAIADSVSPRVTLCFAALFLAAVVLLTAAVFWLLTETAFVPAGTFNRCPTHTPSFFSLFRSLNAPDVVPYLTAMPVSVSPRFTWWICVAPPDAAVASTGPGWLIELVLAALSSTAVAEASNGRFSTFGPDCNGCDRK